MLVGHSTVGVPAEVWQAELDYYCVDVANGFEERHQILQKTMSIIAEKLDNMQSETLLQELECYTEIVVYLIEHLDHTMKEFCFVAGLDFGKSHYPVNLQFKTLKFFNQDRFVSYCLKARIGTNRIMFYDKCERGSHCGRPANLLSPIGPTHEALTFFARI